MKKYRVLLLLFCVLLCSCSQEGIEVYDSDYSSYPDGIASDYSLSEWVILPQGNQPFRAERKNGELCLIYKGTVEERTQYEAILANDWYLRMKEQYSQNDRISTFLHPTGWRIAIYDNRRNSNLRQKFGEESYVYELRIAKLVFDRSVFPTYPEDHRPLGLSYTEFDAIPDNLPEGFFALPENIILEKSVQSESGLWLVFLTTNTQWRKTVSSFSEYGYNIVGRCYASENGDYFYYTSEKIRIQKEGFDYSDLPKDPASRGILAIDELPETDEEINDTTFCRIRLQVVRSEWVPDFWENMNTYEE